MDANEISCPELASATDCSPNLIAQVRTGRYLGRDLDIIKKIARCFKNKGIKKAYSILIPIETNDFNKNKKQEVKKPMLTNDILEKFNLKSEPFLSGFIPKGQMLETPNFKKAVNLILTAVNKGHFFLMTGETGTGKSIVLNAALHKLSNQKRIKTVLPDSINTPVMTPYYIMNEVIEAVATVKIPLSRQRRTKTMASAMADVYKKRFKVSLIIDEAQDLTRETLISLKRYWEKMSKYPELFSIILVGLPEIDFLLAATSLKQVRDRLFSHKLTSFNTDHITDEINAYIQHRVKCAGSTNGLFTESAITAISKRVETLQEVNCIATGAIAKAYELGENPITGELIDLV
jgi:type II secretory pathway predicted ATPase ExeA